MTDQAELRAAHEELLLERSEAIRVLEEAGATCLYCSRTPFEPDVKLVIAEIGPGKDGEPEYGPTYMCGDHQGSNDVFSVRHGVLIPKRKRLTFP